MYDPIEERRGNGGFELLWLDALKCPHETGDRFDQDPDEEMQEIVWWRHTKWDWRVCGPAGQVFPRPVGWLLRGKRVALDTIRVSTYTRELTMRKFETPACQAAWNSRLNANLPWSKIWKITSTFATPRDQLTGLKLQHRNLYVAQREPHDQSCRACTEEESMLHLCECEVIREEYWNELIDLAVKTGMRPPDDITIFLATGALSRDRVISRYHSIIWFLGWRCLYAEIVNSRVEGRTIDLEKALKRAVSMLIGRLRAYGLRWKVWAQASKYRSKKNKIGKKHRNKKLLFQTEDGEYIIHDAVLDMAKYLELIK